MERFLLCGAALCGIIGGVIDVRSNRIPNWLTYTALGLALASRTLWGGWPALKQGLWGALLGGGVFFLFFLVRGMGAGDVKLMGAGSAWAGLHGAVKLLIATAYAGGAIALVYIVFHKQVGTTIRNLGTLLKFHLTSGIRPHPKLSLQSKTARRLPYGLAIAIGSIYLLISSIGLRG